MDDEDQDGKLIFSQCYDGEVVAIQVESEQNSVDLAAIEEFDENDILDSINECASVNSGDDDDDEIPLEENLTLKHLFS